MSGYSTTYKALLDAIDIYVAPQVNPDGILLILNTPHSFIGYEYSRLHDRMWRKSKFIQIVFINLIKFQHELDPLKAAMVSIRIGNL